MQAESQGFQHRRVAILDMYDGFPGQGKRCIATLIQAAGLDYEFYDSRQLNEYPNLSDHDIFISTGGPGDPHDVSSSEWGSNYFKFLDDILVWNNENPDSPKFAFLICHSFQMACIHWKLGDVTKRKSTSFGIFPVHKTEAGHSESLLENLAEPFYVVDSRDYQVVKPNEENLNALGAKVLCIEKERPHVLLERAMMAVRFSPHVFGTQFHPEGDPQSMRHHLTDAKRIDEITTTYGKEKFDWLVSSVDDPEKIIHTYNTLIPEFLVSAMEAIESGLGVQV